MAEKTGIDLPAESTPVAGVNYHAYDSMGIVELSSSSFGQSFQVTPIQMITAASATINGGHLVQPYVVKQIVDSDKNIVFEVEKGCISKMNGQKRQNIRYPLSYREQRKRRQHLKLPKT